MLPSALSLARREANCTAHARRGIVDQFPNFPAECTWTYEATLTGLAARA